MTLTFSPALRTATPLSVAPGGGQASFRFTATFSSRGEYERALQEGTRIEMWTNLAADGRDGKEWHALSFRYPEHEEAGSANDAGDAKVVSLASAYSESQHAQPQSDATVVLDVNLAAVRPGATYSFTYRLVRASGAIEWLGAYGQNGDLVVEEKDVRYTLAKGSKFEDGAVVHPQSAGPAIVATLNKSLDWVCWGFSADGCKGPHTSLSLSPSGAALLVPRPSATQLVNVQPLLLKAEHGAVAIESNGDIVLHDSSRLAVLSADSLASLPGITLVGTNGTFAILASEGKNGRDAPVSLSFIPVSREAWKTASTDVRLTGADVRSVLGSDHDSAVLINFPAFGIWEAGEDLLIKVPAPGAQCIIAPLHNLASSKDAESVELALLSTSSSARIETFEDVARSALLTPPPSPPSRFAKGSYTPSSLPATPSVNILPTLMEASEEQEVSKDATLTSTPSGSTDETVEETVEEATKETVEELPVKRNGPEEFEIVIPRRPDHPLELLKSLISFIFWLVKPALDKIWTFLGGNLLWLMAYRWFKGTSAPGVRFLKDNEKVIVHEVQDEVPSESSVAAEEPSEELSVIAEESEPDTDDVRQQLFRAQSDITVVSEASTMVCEAEDIEEDFKVLPKALEAASPSPILAHIEIPAQPLVANQKSRLVADVHDSVLSLLVHVKAKATALPELDVTIDGEKLQSEAKCMPLFDGVYLLAMPLADGASKLQVALRQ